MKLILNVLNFSDLAIGDTVFEYETATSIYPKPTEWLIKHIDYKRQFVGLTKVKNTRDTGWTIFDFTGLKNYLKT